MALLVSQKNELFTLIESAGFAPAQFRFDESDSNFNILKTVPKLVYIPHPEYAFLFDRKGRRDVHYVYYSPGLHNLIEDAHPGTDWIMVKAYVKEWLGNLSRELDQPNRWEVIAIALREEQPHFKDDPLAAQPFSVPEYKALCEKLDEASERLGETGLEEYEIEHIRVKFEYLKQKAGSMSRGDWRSIFLGSMTGLIGQLGLSPEAVRALWEMLRSVFQHMLLG
ncbi:MAG: hypothetical protein AB8F95_13380 [Bacteroidia bacterium]